jgi:dUTPase
MNDVPVFKFALREGLSDVFLPTKALEKATGWDVRAATDITISSLVSVKIPLGFRMFAPPGWWMELRPRSSSFTKKHLHCLYGVIDEDWEGQCLFACQYIPEDISSFTNDLTISFGEAIGQIIPVKRQEMLVEKISNEEYDRLTQQRNFSRGVGGFGSTGK